MTARHYQNVVVGGGVAGLLGALLKANAGESVLLVEHAPNLGGLLRSHRLSTGHWVDYGTHFMADSGVPELDALLRSVLPPDALEHFSPINAGTYAFGRRSDHCASLDLRGLGQELEARIVAEALTTTDGNEVDRTLAERVERLFGPTAHEVVFAPVMQKLCGAETTALAPEAMRLFSLGRVVVLTPEASRRLKETPHGDARFSFHSNTEGANRAVAYYPKEGGIGRWTSALAEAAVQAGTEAMLGTSVTAVRHRDGGGLWLTLSDATSVTCDSLVWSLPLASLRTALGEPSAPPPRFRASHIEHLVFDRPFKSEAHYLHCYGPDVAPFRVTLYPNFTTTTAPGFHCTVETLLSPSDTVDPSSPGTATYGELVRMGIVTPEARLEHVETHLERAAFPLMTPAYAERVRAEAEHIRKILPECICIGKASGENFFMVDVLRETFTRCSESTRALRSSAA